MITRLTLKARINLIIAVIVGNISILGSILVIQHVRESVARETGSALQLAQEMLEASRLQGPIPEELIGHWMAMMAQLSHSRHVQLQVIRHEGTPRWPAGQVSVAGVPKWFTTAVTPPQRLVEQRIPTRQGDILRVFLLADPQDEVSEAWNETRVFLGLIMLLAAGFFTAISWVLGRAFRPVETILEGLVALERGDYLHHLPAFVQPEWGRIASAFNHCAGVLEQTRINNRNLTRQLLKVEEEERRSLAHELHDEMGQLLSAIKIMALSIRKHRQPDQTIQAARLIAENVDRLFDTIHSMTQKLRPLMLDDLGLTVALENLVSTWRDKQQHTKIQLDCDPAIDDFPREQRIHVYRIVQECVTNTIRHANADTMHIDLRCGETPDRWLIIRIRDDGQGCGTLPTGGFGLRGMRERVESLGGNIKLTTAPEQGFTIEIHLPYEEETPS